jgi:hypothetical protein
MDVAAPSVSYRDPVKEEHPTDESDTHSPRHQLHYGAHGNGTPRHEDRCRKHSGSKSGFGCIHLLARIVVLLVPFERSVRQTAGDRCTEQIANADREKECPECGWVRDVEGCSDGVRQRDAENIVGEEDQRRCQSLIKTSLDIPASYLRARLTTASKLGLLNTPKHLRGLSSTTFLFLSSIPRAPCLVVSGKVNSMSRKTRADAMAMTVWVVRQECQCASAPPTTGAIAGPSWHAEKKRPRATPLSARGKTSAMTAGPTISLAAPRA